MAQVELERRLNRLSMPLYILGAFLFVVSAGDLFITMWTSRMSDPLYRYSAVSASSRGLVVPILGLAILQITAALFSHRRTRTVLMVLTVILLIGILMLLPLHVLDALEAFELVPGDRQGDFTTTTTLGIWRISFAWVVLATGLWTSWKSRRWDQTEPPGRRHRRNQSAKGLGVEKKVSRDGVPLDERDDDDEPDTDTKPASA